MQLQRTGLDPLLSFIEQYAVRYDCKRSN